MIEHTDQYWVVLTTGIQYHIYIKPQQLRLLGRFIKLILMASVTIWICWFNLVNMVPQTQQILLLWDTMLLIFSRGTTLYSKTLKTMEKLLQLENSLFDLYARKDKLVLGKKIAATSHSCSNTHYFTSMS